MTRIIVRMYNEIGQQVGSSILVEGSGSEREISGEIHDAVVDGIEGLTSLEIVED